MSQVHLQSDVAEALTAGRPVVAVESAFLTTGLPNEPLKEVSSVELPGIDGSQPTNLATACAIRDVILDSGALPAFAALIKGSIFIGLDNDQLVQLAHCRTAGKASVVSLAEALTKKRSAGLTVSATAHVCQLLNHSHSDSMPIRVLATGGIGGVHRGWQSAPDVSVDLHTISESPMCVVCSGAKSMMDTTATLEVLESLGVPVIGYQTDSMPAFVAKSSGSPMIDMRVDEVEQAARLCYEHWVSLKRRSGVILANQVPDDFGMEFGEVEASLAKIEQDRLQHTKEGPQRTPALLAELARLSNGRSVAANVALLVANARLASTLAAKIARLYGPDFPPQSLQKSVDRP